LNSETASRICAGTLLQQTLYFFSSLTLSILTKSSISITIKRLNLQMISVFFSRKVNKKETSA
jgi:hypothetical protein